MKKKVLKLLKDMQGQLESEKAKEEEVYAKLSCWCEVNGKEKDAAVRTSFEFSKFLPRK